MLQKTLRRVKLGSLRDQTATSIKDAILDGGYGPGDALREVELARGLGVSQATVREALVQLQQTGLVVRIPNKETMVTRLPRQELQERIAIRILLEGEATVTAANNMPDSHFEVLQTLLQKVVEASNQGDYLKSSAADLDFHRYIWDQSGNTTLVRLLDELTTPMFAFMCIAHRANLHHLRSVMRSHKPILVAMKGRDEGAIRESIRKHLETSYSEFLASGVKDLEAFTRLAHPERLG